jgi:hypothetical protein
MCRRPPGVGERRGRWRRRRRNASRVVPVAWDGVVSMLGARVEAQPAFPPAPCVAQHRTPQCHAYSALERVCARNAGTMYGHGPVPGIPAATAAAAAPAELGPRPRSGAARPPAPHRRPGLRYQRDGWGGMWRWGCGGGGGGGGVPVAAAAAGITTTGGAAAEAMAAFSPPSTSPSPSSSTTPSPSSSVSASPSASPSPSTSRPFPLPLPRSVHSSPTLPLHLASPHL